MTPLSLVASLARERELTAPLRLPARLVFDAARTVVLAETIPGHLTLDCALDGILPGTDPLLQQRLLAWNHLSAIVGGGAFSLDASGATVHYRVTLRAADLDLGEFKARFHEFLSRVEKFDDALVTDPFEMDREFTIEAVSEAPPSGAIQV